MESDAMSDIDQLSRPDRLGLQIRLAMQIADDAARSDIECFCAEAKHGTHRWYDTGQIDSDDPAVQTFVHTSLRYLRLRDHLITSIANPALVRFRV